MALVDRRLIDVMPKVLLAFACLITGTLILLSASCGGLGIFAFFDTSPYRGWNILAGAISIVFAVATGVTGRLLFRRIRRNSLATPSFRFAWMAAAVPLLGAAAAVLILDLHAAALPDAANAILAGDRVVCSAWRTGILPERGQAVPFEYEGRTVFWRLIALPQDRLNIRYGAVYVNDTAVEGARPIRANPHSPSTGRRSRIGVASSKSRARKPWRSIPTEGC